MALDHWASKQVRNAWRHRVIVTPPRNGGWVEVHYLGPKLGGRKRFIGCEASLAKAMEVAIRHVTAYNALIGPRSKKVPIPHPIVSHLSEW